MHLRAKPSRFVILFNGRTGAIHVVEALRSDPRFDIRGERLADLKPEGAADQLTWMRDFYKRKRDRSIRAVGFKAKPFDILDQSAFAALVRDLDVRIIHLHRRNIVRAAVATINADRMQRETGNRDPDHAPEPFELDIAELRHSIDVIAHADSSLVAYIASMRQPTLDLCYEDLGARPADAVAALSRFLHVDLDTAILARVADRQAAPCDLRKILTNYDDVARTLLGTPHAAMLEDDS